MLVHIPVRVEESWGEAVVWGSRGEDDVGYN
jgi:hypothetical protein